MIFRGPSSPWAYRWFYIWNPCHCLALQAIPLFELKKKFIFLLIRGNLLPVSKAWGLCITLESPYSPSGVNFWNSMYYLPSFHGPCRSWTWRSPFTMDNLWIDLPFPSVLSLSRPLSPFLSSSLLPSLSLSLLSFFFSLIEGEMLACNHLSWSCLVSRVWLFETLSIIAHQAPLSMGFSRQEYWSGLPSPPPWNLSNPGIKPASLMSPALAGEFFTTSATWEAHLLTTWYFYFLLLSLFLKDIWFNHTTLLLNNLTNLHFSWGIKLASLSYLFCHQMDAVLLQIDFMSLGFPQWIRQMCQLI